MSKFKKMKLVPYEDYSINTNNNHKIKEVIGSLHQSSSPWLKQASNLDDQMSNILRSNVDDYHKAKLYTQALKKYLIYKHKYNNQTNSNNSINKVVNVKKIDDSFKINNDNTKEDTSEDQLESEEDESENYNISELFKETIDSKPTNIPSLQEREEKPLISAGPSHFSEIIPPFIKPKEESNRYSTETVENLSQTPPINIGFPIDTNLPIRKAKKAAKIKIKKSIKHKKGLWIPF